MKIVSYNYNKDFFSFYNIFFYTKQAFVFHLLKDFRIFDDHIVVFFFFFRKTLISQKDFDIFRELFFVVFLCTLDRI